MTTPTSLQTMDATRMTIMGSDLRKLIQRALCLSDFNNIPGAQKEWLENLIVSLAFASHQRALRESPQTVQQQPSPIPLEGVGTSASEAIHEASQTTKLGRMAPLPDAQFRTFSVSSDEAPPQRVPEPKATHAEEATARATNRGPLTGWDID